MHKHFSRFYNSDNNQRIYFITIVIKHRIVFFDINLLKEIFTRNLNIAQYFHKFCIYSYTIQKDHVHLLIQPLGKKTNISKIMKFIKKNFSYNINYLSSEQIVGADNIPRRINNKHTTLQKEVIKNHWLFLAQLQKRWPPQMIYFQWQESYHDHIIRDYKDFKNHSFYIKNNTQKHAD